MFDMLSDSEQGFNAFRNIHLPRLYFMRKGPKLSTIVKLEFYELNWGATVGLKGKCIHARVNTYPWQKGFNRKD